MSVNALMTKGIMPVNTFITVEWTKGPLSKMEIFRFSLELPTMYRVFLLLLFHCLHGYLGYRSFVPLDYVNVCMSVESS